MTKTFDYFLFGLHLRSELCLPELLALDLTSEPQVYVGFGNVPEAASGGLCAIEGGVQLTVESIARYAIIGGSQIIIDRSDDVADTNVRLYLLGSVMGALLHQRGVLPLHANAVKIGGKAFAFAGMSGAGKSTLAARFSDLGYKIIADDVSAINFDDHLQPWVASGLPRLRLWRETLEALGRDTGRYERSYAGDESWDKFDVPLPHETASRSPFELAGIYLLSKGDRFVIDRLHGVDAIKEISANTYRGGYIPAAGNVRRHWESCVRLVTQTPIFRFSRAWDLAFLSADISALVEHTKKPASEIGAGTPRAINGNNQGALAASTRPSL